jgi:hypothetical protein
VKQQQERHIRTYNLISANTSNFIVAAMPCCNLITENTDVVEWTSFETDEGHMCMSGQGLRLVCHETASLYTFIQAKLHYYNRPFD